MNLEIYFRSNRHRYLKELNPHGPPEFFFVPIKFYKFGFIFLNIS